MRLIVFISTMLSLLFNACHSIYTADTKKSAVTRLAIRPADSIIQREGNGAEFFAYGSSPVKWTLEVDLDKGFFFKPADGRLLIASPVPVSKLAGAEMYEAKTDLGPMKITVYKDVCATSLKDNKMSNKVEVTLPDKRYTGCGEYLYNYLLNDIWILESINSKALLSAAYKKQFPVMEFNLEKNKMFGYDGCSNINSDILVQGNHIKFSGFAGTTTSCRGNEAARIFSTMLSNHTVDYYIKMGRLVMSLSDDSKLVFRKSD